MSFSNRPWPVSANSACDRSIASAELPPLPVSTESSCADSSVATSMPPADTTEDSVIETPLSVSSSLPRVRKVLKPASYLR